MNDSIMSEWSEPIKIVIMHWEQREQRQKKMFLREKKEVCLVVCVLAIASYANGSSSNSSLNRYLIITK